MSDKCEKYESLFTFGTEEELAKHLEICEDCQQEHLKMQKVQNLVKQVKPYYKNSTKKKINPNITKIAAAFTVLCLAYFSANCLMTQNSTYEYDLTYLESDSIVFEMGLPTDEYGLLMVY